MSKEKINPSQEYEYLQFVDFKVLKNWSLYTLSKQNFLYNKIYTLTKIGSFLTRSKDAIKIIDNISYKRPTIQMNGNGIKLRDEIIGKLIGTKNQFRVKKGQFLLSKIDARNGAFGLVPYELDQCIITGNFWTFDVDYSILEPLYLSLLTRTKKFQNLCQNASVGTTNRNYLQQDLFLNFEVPLPPLEKQKELVAIYNQKNLEAEEKEQKANQLEKSIDEYLMEELGIELPTIKQNQDGFLKFVEFKDLSRWDNNFFRKNKSNYTSRYPIVNFNQIIKFLKNGIAARNFSEKGLEYLRVGNVRDNKIIDKDLKYTKTFTNNDVLKKGTLLITRKGTVGESAIVKFDNKFVASSEIFIITLFDSVGGIEINNNYISFVNSSSFIQEQYKEKSTGAFMPSISQQKLRSLHFPLPPLPIQNQIANKISSIKQEIKTLRSEAENLKTQAKEEFEKEVFS